MAAVDSGECLHTEIVAAIGDFGAVADRYASVLGDAFKNNTPPYSQYWYGERFRGCAIDPNWMAGCLVANAQKEADGSRKLWALSGSAGEPQIAEEVRQHALDESRHANFYISMLTLAFPGCVEGDAVKALHKISPAYRSVEMPPRSADIPIDRVMDDICQMNIGEIRTRVHQQLLRPVLMAWCPPSRRTALKGILDKLLHDETKHIAYTAGLIETFVEGGYGDYVRGVYSRRVQDFNKITLEEVGVSDFSGS